MDLGALAFGPYQRVPMHPSWPSSPTISQVTQAALVAITFRHSSPLLVFFSALDSTVLLTVLARECLSLCSSSDHKPLQPHALYSTWDSRTHLEGRRVETWTATPSLGHEVWIGYSGAMWPSSSPCNTKSAYKTHGRVSQPPGACFHVTRRPSKANILYSSEATPVVLTWGQ